MDRFWLGLAAVLMLSILFLGGCGTGPEDHENPPSQESGSLYVTSVPLGASVYVDGLLKGQTPLSVMDLSKGSHMIRLELNGYDTHSATALISSGETLNISVTLQHEALPIGNLSVITSPTGAKLYIDGKYKGITPITVPDLDSGHHSIRLTRTGYLNYSATANIVAGQTTNLSVELERYVEPSGYLYVRSDPTEAKVYVDGKLKGATPITVEDLAVGNHSLKLTLVGYLDYKTTVIIYEDRTTRITPVLEPGAVLTGNLFVESVPTSASLYIDAKLKGTTPITVNLTEGNHSVKIAKTGYSTYLSNIIVVAGQTTYLNVNLEENITLVGSLFAASNPTGADLYVDGVLKGTTPLTLPDLPIGSHPVVMANEGYSDYTSNVVIVAGQTTYLNATLVVNTVPTGNLNVQSTPTNASIYLNGALKGTTPKLLGGLTEGNYDLKLSKAGYYDYLSSIHVYAGQTVNLSITLVSNTTQHGNLYVQTTPANATLYVDDVLKGPTPLTVEGLAVGTHLIRLEKANYTTYETSVYIYSNHTTSMNVALVPISP